MRAAARQTATRVIAQVATGIATAGVYLVLGVLLSAGLVPLALAGTAVLAIRSAQASLANLLHAVNQCYEEGLYFSDYLAFCADATRRIPPPGTGPVPDGFDRITADRVTFSALGYRAARLRRTSRTLGFVRNFWPTRTVGEISFRRSLRGSSPQLPHRRRSAQLSTGSVQASAAHAAWQRMGSQPCSRRLRRCRSLPGH
jgi:hypothetical protein